MVKIRKFEEKDVENKVKWINDNENNQYLHYLLPLEVDKTIDWFKKNQERTDRYDAVIEYNSLPVGIIGLLNIVDGRAEYYITLGNKEFKGKGIAKKATLILLEYAFKVLHLRMIYLYTEVGNKSAHKLFEKCGFYRSSLEKKSCLNRGKLVDRYRYQISVSDFFKSELPDIDTTLVYELERGMNHVFIKRDDMIPVSFGGNKARKAVKFFERIDKGAYGSVLTYGSSSSNHCRIISNMASARNLPCYIICPQESSEPTYNSKMMQIFGAELSVVPVERVHESIEKKLKELREKNRNPYFIPGGGHSILGTQAYVECYEEIRNYEMKNGIHFDYIFFASGTGTTQAGLICGQIIGQDNRKIVGISIARKSSRGKQIILDSIKEYLNENQIDCSNTRIEELTIFEDKYTGIGYGKDNDKIRCTIRDILLRHGIPMDATYTAKAYVGMKEYLAENDICGKNILFIHTGGTPLFFDYLEEI